MNDSPATQIARSLTADLRAFREICEDTLFLAKREYQALAGQGDYPRFEFSQKREALLSDIEPMGHKFRGHRMAWQQISQARREQFEEVKQLFDSIQGLLTRILLLDRENQQVMLKRGLVPARQVPAAAVQQPHYVANLYRRNSLG